MLIGCFGTNYNMSHSTHFLCYFFTFDSVLYFHMLFPFVFWRFGSFLFYSCPNGFGEPGLLVMVIIHKNNPPCNGRAENFLVKVLK